MFGHQRPRCGGDDAVGALWRQCRQGGQIDLQLVDRKGQDLVADLDDLDDLVLVQILVQNLNR